LQRTPEGKGSPIGAENLRRGRRVFQKLLRKADPIDVKIVVDGQTLTGDLLCVEVVNVSYTGPALSLAPGADPGDGKFEVVIVPTGRRKDMAAWLEAPHECAPPVVVHRGRKIVMTGDFPDQRVDDDVFRPSDDQAISIELEHEAAKILVPRPMKSATKGENH
jgi:diacylglycerol kinase family enzyme